MDEKEFGDYLLEFLTKEYKATKFEKSDDPLVVYTEDLQLGLESLYKKYRDSEVVISDFHPVLKEHFDSIFSQIEIGKKAENIGWEEASKIIRPMFAPLTYVEKIDIFHQRIDSDVMSAFVLDSESGYKYVSSEDIKNWGISEQEARDHAEKNLRDASKDTPMQGNLDQVKFLVVQSYDGYDAARLLVPQFRDFVASKLGYPFHAGIPNRDFLIMWSIENPETMKSGFADSIRIDFQEKPYPLTPNVLVVTQDKVVPLE